MRLGFLLVLAVLAARTASAELVARPVTYMDGETVLEGYLAYDAAVSGERPGVLIAHQWKGLGDHEKARAEALARMGYVALAIDVYGKGIRPETQPEAAALSSKYKGDRELLRRRVAAGLEAIKRQERVDPSRVAAIGYCFGGTAALELARSGAPVLGVVSFHGGLSSPKPEDAARIKGRVLALHGAEDPFVPPAEVAAFQEEMGNAKVDWQLISYGGAVHSFTDKSAGKDKSKGAAYNDRADQRSWRHMRGFLAEIFAK